MAHNNWEQLRILLTLLDDSRNDIFLHIDKKAIDCTASRRFGGSSQAHDFALYSSNGRRLGRRQPDILRDASTNKASNPLSV